MLIAVGVITVVAQVLLKRAFIEYNITILFSAHVKRIFSAGDLVRDNLKEKMTDHHFEMTFIKI